MNSKLCICPKVLTSKAAKKLANAGVEVAGIAISHAIHKQLEKALEGFGDDSKNESENCDSESKEKPAVQRFLSASNEPESSYEDSYVSLNRKNV